MADDDVFTASEEACLNAEAEAEDRKAITRWPSWRQLFGDAGFNIGIFLLLVLALVEFVLLAVAIVSLGLAGLSLLGVQLGWSAGQFFGLFIACVVLRVTMIVIVKAFK